MTSSFPPRFRRCFRALWFVLRRRICRDSGWQESLEGVFPSSTYARVSIQENLDPWTFRFYLTGLAIFLLGGSGAFIALWRSLAIRSAGRGLFGPLVDVSARPRLVWGLHLFYFGLVIGGSLLSFLAREAQVVLLGKIRELVRVKDSPLGTLGESFANGNIPLLAALILAFNFIVGACVDHASIDSDTGHRARFGWRGATIVGAGACAAVAGDGAFHVATRGDDAGRGRGIYSRDVFRAIDPELRCSEEPGRESVHAIRACDRAEFQGAVLDCRGVGGGGGFRGRGVDIA